MRFRVVALGSGVALVLLVVNPGLIHAGATPSEKCAVAKNKAAVKKLGAKLKCWQKAIGAGLTTPDSTCISTAETKFTTAMNKAETKGGCDFTGDAPTIEAVVNAAVAGLAALTSATPYVCCDCVGDLCAWAVDGVSCTNGGCSPGAAGTVCDGATGNCIAPPATAGGCCSNPSVVPGIGTCVAVDETSCETTYSGTFIPNAVCPQGGGPCVPL